MPFGGGAFTYQIEALAKLDGWEQVTNAFRRGGLHLPRMQNQLAQLTFKCHQCLSAGGPSLTPRCCPGSRAWWRVTNAFRRGGLH